MEVNNIKDVIRKVKVYNEESEQIFRVDREAN